MIEGITVLNKIAITGLPTWSFLTLLAVFIISVGVVIFTIRAEWNEWVGVISAILAIATLFLLIILSNIIKTGEYRYECTIDDSVSYNDIVKNYKIIEQRGDIWVLEDK